MTYQPHTHEMIRKKRARRREFVISGISVALVAAGLGGWVIDQERSDPGGIPRVALAATQQTTIGTYSNAQARITIRKRVSGSGNSTVTAYVADVRLTTATALRAVFAKKRYGKNIIALPSSMARSVNAVFAVNGDYYGFRDNGIIVRNGVAYRSKGVRKGLALHRKGTMVLYDERRQTARTVVAKKVWHTLSFGPGLVQAGRVQNGIDTYEIGDVLNNGKKTTIQGYQPRTGIGMIGKNHFVMIVVDGRDPGYSRGVTMRQFAQMFLDEGATLAYNLDGGGSATMYFKGGVVNRPRNGSNVLTERASSDILYIPR